MADVSAFRYNKTIIQCGKITLNKNAPIAML